MPLQAPPNYQNAVIAVAVGVGLSLVIFTTNRSTLPIAGDQYHRFPFGGCYKDGTKAASYFAPTGKTYGDNPSYKFVAFVGVVLLTLVILARSPNQRPPCNLCQRNHA